MKTIHCVLADDERLAREIITDHVNMIENIKVIAECKNGTEVINFFKIQKADLLLLDIQMPKLDGIELLRSNNLLPPVIIISAFPEFALVGYEFNVIDYLLKPVSLHRFSKAITKFRDWDKLRTEVNPEHSIKEMDIRQDFINVKFNKNTIRLPLEDINYFEGLKDYVKIYTKETIIVTYQTLSYFEKELGLLGFLRIHRSYIISVKKVQNFNATKIQINGIFLPVGRTYSKAITSQLGQDFVL